MDEEELSLPTLPKASNDPQLPLTLPSQPFKSRKRSTRSYDLLDDDTYASSLHTSSDPALFSSDETPDAENYSGGKRRKKKTYAGTWWGEKHGKAGSFSSNSSRARRNTKRKFARNLDSGIFMCSDDGSTDLSSDSSLGAELLEDQRRADEAGQRALLRTPPPTRTSKLSLTYTSASPQSPIFIKKPVVIDPKHQMVRDVIRKMVDESCEEVDLSGMRLESLPPETRELTFMVKNDLSNLIHFDSLVARPRLYLANNILRQFPSPVLDLSNLRLLSLRQNKLTYLPPGIRSLTRLETLNISANKLQSLPIEVLDLLTKHRLSVLLCDPNPWMERPSDSEHQNIDRSRSQRVSAQPRHITHPPPEVIAWRTPFTLIASNAKPSDNIQRKVPSLSELVLRQLSVYNSSKRDLSTLLADDAPASVTTLLQELHRAQNDGGRQCAYCGGDMVVAKRKWTEWWDIMSPGTVLQSGIVRTGDYETLRREIPSQPSLVLPFEVAVCGGCE